MMIGSEARALVCMICKKGTALYILGGKLTSIFNSRGNPTKATQGGCDLNGPTTVDLDVITGVLFHC